MENLLARYLRWHRSVGHSPKTLRHHETTISLFLRWCDQHGYGTKLDALNADTVREWQQFQQDNELSLDTVATRTRSLKAFSRWLVEEEVLEKDPLRRVSIPKLQDKAKVVLTPEQVDKLLAVCDKQTLTGLRDIAIMLLLYSTGIRISELLALRQDDVNWKEGQILVQAGKGGKFRVLPLGAKAERALHKYLAKRSDDQPYLFVTDDEKPLAYQGAKMIFRRHGTKAGVKVHAHLFRHSFAVQYLRNGGKLETLKAIMGHSEYEITLHYARIAGVDVVAGHEVADPAKALKSR